MSWYEMHRCVYDFIRLQEQASEVDRSFESSGYDLSIEERAAFNGQDIAAFYSMGLHPVLLNRYARQIGLTREDYRSLLQPLRTDDARTGRWQR